VVSILYRQGPEYTFPAGSEDMLKVWNYYTKSYKPQNVGMVGCSAGGSLITQTAAMLIKAGRPTPGVLGSYCAGLGANFSGDSQFFGNLAVTNVSAAMAQAARAPVATGAVTAAPVMGVAGPADRNYYTGVDLSQFIANPTVDEKLLAKFPPTIFFTATRDMALSAAAYGHRKLVKLGIDSELMIFDGLYHGFMTNPDFPESQEGYRTAAAFFDRHLGR
jgi:acetyl esterase/lipase